MTFCRTLRWTLPVGVCAALVLGVCALAPGGFVTARAAPVVPPAQSRSAQSAEDVRFAPHRALYEVTLSSVKSGGQLVDIRGRMYFAWKKTCESWNTDHRSSLVYEYADGTSARINSDFASYETLDGKDMSFSSRRENNGVPFEEFRGHASLDANADGSADYSIPGDLKFRLPKNTFFPMQHTAEILARARRGEKFFNAALFDGSDDQGPQQVNVFIGETVDPISGLRLNKNIDSALLKAPAHRMRLAFFPSEDADNKEPGAAAYEMDLTALDNGVVSDIKIIYDTFTISQKLVALERIDMPVCTENSAYQPAAPVKK
ncbi:MAG: DUF1849 family protein [Rhodospirillales bacterium]|nr:DUF1849 family protein [Alphaproteobacteria bacterium]MCB9986957.1 DUF1849 family protein [Rhodospirillales bacterium]USO08268.1 MAG: DUF1849 family protein [Rhodospirillales bacterium]